MYRFFNSGIFPEIFRTFPGNFPDISWTFPENILEMSWKFPGKIPEISRKLRGISRTFPGNFPKFIGNFPEISRIFSGKFPGNFPEISRTFPGHFPEISRKFPGNFRKFPGNFPEISPRVWKFLRFPRESQGKIRTNQEKQEVQGLNFLHRIFYIFSDYTTAPYVCHIGRQGSRSHILPRFELRLWGPWRWLVTS